MTDPFPPQEETAVLDPAPDPVPAPPAAFVVDRIRVQVIVGRMEGGNKTAELPTTVVEILYPFDQLPGLAAAAVQQAQEESANG